MNVELKCEYCHQSFYRRKGDANRKRNSDAKVFCTISCKQAHFASGQVVVGCFNCKKLIVRKQSEILKSISGKFYCSHSCSAKTGNANRIVDEETRRRISSSLKGRHLENISIDQCQHCGSNYQKKRQNRKYCSMKCYNTAFLRQHTGEISTRTWQKIFKRAFFDWKCPYCDWTLTFDIHHIVPRRNGLNNDISNLVLLCPNHHSLISRNLWQPEDISDYAVDKYFSVDELANFYDGKIRLG